MNSIVLTSLAPLVTDSDILSHLHSTLKSQKGDTLKCTILNQGLCSGTILELDKSKCLFSFSEILPAKNPWFNLIVALSRPQTMKKVLEHATTFGANEFHFFKAALSEKSYLDSKLFKEDEYLEYLKLGLAQSAVYANLPIFKLDKYNPADTYKQKNQKFILDLTATESFKDLENTINFNAPITLAAGPERGFTTEEIEYFHSAGFKRVKISSSILRVEHAIYSAISQLELLRGEY